MMIRRVLCVVLACQLLLVQGLLTRCCHEPPGTHSHAEHRPHIHSRQFLPLAVAQQEPIPATDSHLGETPEDEDAIPLPADFADSKSARSAAEKGISTPVAFTSAPPVTLPAQDEPRQAALPPPRGGTPETPLYLKHLALLI